MARRFGRCLLSKDDSHVPYNMPLLVQHLLEHVLPLARDTALHVFLLLASFSPLILAFSDQIT